MLVDRPVHDAELAFLNAPFNENGWSEAIARLAEASGSGVVQMCGGGLGPSLTFNIFSEDRHDPHGHLVNPTLYGPENWRINCVMGGSGSIQHERHYAAYRSIHRTDFYDDAVSDLDLPFGCQSPLVMDSCGLIGLSLLRSARDGPCTSDILHSFTRVARQAQRAVRVALALGQDRAEQMLGGLTQSRDMTLLLDRQGRLMAMTELAERLFDRPDGLRFEGLAVRLAHKAEDRDFQAAAGRLLASDGITGPILHEAVAGRSATRPGGCWRLFLTRIPARFDLLGVEAQLALTLRPIRPEDQRAR